MTPERSVLELARRSRDFLTRAGALEVCPPLLEPVETFAGVEGLQDEGLFRVVDGGEVLVLRPDATLPLARRVAAAGVPARARLLAYVLPVVRRRPEGGTVELWQAGVERVAPPGDRDDVGLLRLALGLLAALGAGRPVVVLGHARLLGALLEAVQPDPAAREGMLRALARREVPAVRAALSAAGARGSEAAVRALDPLCDPEERRAAVAELAGAGALAPWARELLAAAEEVAGVADVQVDPGLVRRPAYYDGLVFEVGLAGSARPVAGGGRCDGVLRRFGAEGSWCGFAVDLEELARALQPAAGWDAGPAGQGAHEGRQAIH